jgi:hypothetical protein
MDKNNIRITAASEFERLAGAERDNAHLDAGLLLEGRQDVPEESRLLGRRRRGDGNELIPRQRAAGGDRQQQRKKEATRDYQGNSPSRKRAASDEAGFLRNWSAG